MLVLAIRYMILQWPRNNIIIISRIELNELLGKEVILIKEGGMHKITCFRVPIGLVLHPIPVYLVVCRKRGILEDR